MFPGEGRFNRCVVLDHEGEDLWSHDKLREYEITAENVTRNPGVYSGIGVGPGGGMEDILRGEELQFYDSAIGRMAAAICVGFFSSEVEDLLKESVAMLFLVPAMTESITAIDACAEALVHTQHAFTLAANCGIVGAEAPSFCRWPGGRDAVRRLDRGRLLLTFDLKNTSIHVVD